MEHTYGGAVKGVHGLVQIKRWMGGESVHRTSFMAPAVVVAYNVFIIGSNLFSKSYNSKRKMGQYVHLHLDLSHEMLQCPVCIKQQTKK